MHCIVVTSYTSSESDENSRADILNLIDDFLTIRLIIILIIRALLHRLIHRFLI